jgi:L-2-hydroxyglutarate oxidase LhgO
VHLFCVVKVTPLNRYLLLERPPPGTRPLASSTIFPTPDPKLGKGVLVQTTLWGNLILGPTARDVGNPQHDLTKDQCNSFILSKCKQLVDAFDVTHTFHAFAGKSSSSRIFKLQKQPTHMSRLRRRACQELAQIARRQR